MRMGDKSYLQAAQQCGTASCSKWASGVSLRRHKACPLGTLPGVTGIYCVTPVHAEQRTCVCTRASHMTDPTCPDLPFGSEGSRHLSLFGGHLRFPSCVDISAPASRPS